MTVEVNHHHHHHHIY